MAFLASIAGPLLGTLFSHGSASNAGMEVAATDMQAGIAADSAESMLTQKAISHQSTKWSEAVWTADEHVREASLYNEFTLGVQGAEQNVIKKSMQLVDQANQSA